MDVALNLSVLILVKVSAESFVYDYSSDRFTHHGKID